MLRRRLDGFITIIRNILCIFITLLLILVYVIKKNQQIFQVELVNVIPKDAMKYIDFEYEDSTNRLSIETIKQIITEHNSQEPILNLDAHGPVDEDTTVLVIFIDEMSVHLKYLLVSLSQAWGIQDTFIIFSHLYYDESVNNLVKSIDFAPVLQIYYPYSINLYPHEFPGYHPDDCDHTMDIKDAESVNCTNAFTPDIHGHYRNPLQAQKKHFWWWTLNNIFENITVTNKHSGTIIFLDKNLFIMEDFIYTVLHMKNICDTLPQCDFVSVETSTFTDFHETRTWAVEVRTWDPENHSSVLAFDSSVWNSIASNYDLFCTIDDYSWSRSLYYLSLNRRDGNRFRVMSSTLPRAYRTNNCGLYESTLNCNMIETILQVTNIQTRTKHNLFPIYLEVYIDIEMDIDEFVIFDYVENNGGWSDPRDKRMCADMTITKIKKTIMDMKNEFQYYKDTEIV